MMSMKVISAATRRASKIGVQRIRSPAYGRQETSSHFLLQNYADFSTDEKKKESLHDTVNRLKGEKEADGSNQTSAETNEMFSKFADTFGSFSASLSETWDELVNSNKPKDIKKNKKNSKF